MTIGHYLNSMDKLTRQWTPTNFRDPKRQRLYLKDIDCPEAWHQQLRDTIPDIIFYLNECIGEKGGPGAKHERDRYNHLVLGQGIAPAGDLMSNLPPEMRAENMMCYIGHEGTYTPAHREMCATLGQNVMVETSSIDKGEKDGSSIWFMTETKDREVVSEYFLSMLGHDIEVENHFAQLVAWKKAPFPVYIVEQKAGDFILIPPLAPHQVWNRGTRTMKVAWNRTTVETLEMALHEALPRARMVCRDEQYKCKAIVYYSLLKYYDQLQNAEKADESNYLDYQREPVRQAPRVRQLQRDFKRLFALYREILVCEMFSSSEFPKEKNVEFVPFDSNITCSYCRCNIFNRFLTCKTCVGELANGDEDTYDICMDCYAMGRSCGCLSNLQWVEQWHWPDLLKNYEEWRAMVIYVDGYVDEASPQPLEVERERSGKKPMAQICQEQLKRRPWRDITKPMVLEPLPGDSDVEPEADDNGRAKRKKPTKRKSQQLSKQYSACHICRHPEANWKLAFCTTCSNAYCYGTLWRAFDMKPEKIMENANWQCPKCLKICSCGACRRRERDQIPYQPKGTLLGHDTRRVADPRSVESLVDFSRTNLAWLKDENDGDPHNSVRMKKLMEKAEAEKSRDETLEEDLNADQLGPTDVPLERVDDENHAKQTTIDPALTNGEDELEADARITAPAAPMGARALGSRDDASARRHERSSHLHTDNQYQPTLDHQNDAHAFVSPADLMKQPDYSAYPDPSLMGRERMMGIGYYQQRNDADKILFDAPDATTPTGEHPNIAYPRLQSDSEDDLLLRANKKRKRGSMPLQKGRLDEAHFQFLEAQKKQKLNEAKKNERYFLTKNQLEGGKPLKVKLLLPNHKDCLQRIEAFDKGEPAPRHNPRSARTSLANQGKDSEEDSAIVTSDVFNESRQIVDLDDEDELQDTLLVTKSRAGRTSKVNDVEDISDEELAGNDVIPKRRSVGRPSKTSAKEPLQLEGDNQGNQNKRGRGRPRRDASIGGKLTSNKRTRSSELAEYSDPDASKPEKRRRTSAWLERENAADLQELEAPVKSRARRTISSGADEDAEREAEDATNGIEAENGQLTPPESQAQIVVELNVENETISKSGEVSSPEPQFEREEGWKLNDYSDDRDSSAAPEPESAPNPTGGYRLDDSSEEERSSVVPQAVPASERAGGYRLGDYSDDELSSVAPQPELAPESATGYRLDGDSDDEDGDFVVVDDNYNPIPPISQPKSSMVAVSDDYQNAKLEALRMAEAEVEPEEEAAKAKPVIQPRKVAAQPAPLKPSNKTTSTAKQPSVMIPQKENSRLAVKPTVTIPSAVEKDPKFMSVIERHAAQGKTIKIAGPKTRPSFSSVNTSSGSASMKQGPSPIAGSRPTVVVPGLSDAQRRIYSSTTSSSDDDDDEEIPAKRPLGAKPKPGGRVMGLNPASNGQGRPRK